MYSGKETEIIDHSHSLDNVKDDTEVLEGSSVQERQPPDGGFKAWLVVLGAFCVIF